MNADKPHGKRKDARQGWRYWFRYFGLAGHGRKKPRAPRSDECGRGRAAGGAGNDEFGKVTRAETAARDHNLAASIRGNLPQGERQ